MNRKHIHSTKDHWDANLYDVKHSFVSRLGNDLVDLLAPKKGERIIDLGCGTGDLANKLKELIIIKVENNLKGTLFNNGSWIADFKRIRVIGIKQ